MTNEGIEISTGSICQAAWQRQLTAMVKVRAALVRIGYADDQAGPSIHAIVGLHPEVARASKAHLAWCNKSHRMLFSTGAGLKPKEARKSANQFIEAALAATDVDQFIKAAAAANDERKSA